MDDNAEWWEEAQDLAVVVPILVRGEQVETGWEGEEG